MTDPDPVQFADIGNIDGMRARINLRGAELWQWIDHDGAELLWSGDPRIWSGRAPILFPIIGSLAGGVFRYRGAEYALPRHGLARHAMFALVERSSTGALLRLEASDASRAIYPFEFRLDIGFTCAAGALGVTAEVRNLGADAMPFSFGFHPALRWPLEPGGRRADHAIVFSAQEPAPISKLDAQGLILPERQPSPVAGRTLVLQDELFAQDALIWPDLASRSVDYGAERPRERHVRIDFANLPLLGVWTKPGAGYICIEPWQGLADPAGFTGDIFAKPGIVALAPGAAWQARMVLSVVPQR